MTRSPKRSYTRRWAVLAGVTAFSLCPASGRAQTRAELEFLDTSMLAPVPEGRDPALWRLLDDYLNADAQAQPEAASLRGDFRFNDLLSDPSGEAADFWTGQMASLLARLDRLDQGGFGEDDRLDAALLRSTLESGIESARFRPEQTPISSISGPQVWLPQLGSRVPMLSVQHEADYLARLRQVSGEIDATIATMREGIAAGRVPPRVTVLAAPAAARSQATEAIADDPTRSPFYAPFLSRPDSVHAAPAREVIAGEIVPAYARLADFLEREYLPACRETIGASASVDGMAWYEHALRTHTTTRLTAAEIHAIGVAEVERIQRDMMGVIRRTDWYERITSGDSSVSQLREADDDALFPAFSEHLRTDPSFYFTNAEELLTAYRDCAKRIDPELIRLFGVLPRLPYGVREIPRFAARSSPTAYYYPGSAEGGVPGYFMANTDRLDQRPRYDIVPLTLHEAVPGHHLQIALAQEMEGVHPFRRSISVTAFVEGWGLYAEKLGLEMGDDAKHGMFADPYDDFGRLNFEMWRAMRLVVDTGIHAEGWTRDKAIAYMLAHSAKTPVDIANEVDRYIAWPGQACAYKIGELRMLAIRARAEAALGDAFDVRAFHDELLGAGPLPLDVLDERMDRWIAAQKD
ncbi:MAG: DUF885 domain-containing protein [Phycisphaerales bacterium]|jgi:uncharacterized protein (DUF885 family)|nr:DUF885 domain-containing protein [Phycisphaerales bacterium]